MGEDEARANNVSELFWKRGKLYCTFNEGEEVSGNIPGCNKRCPGEERCVVGWPDGSCGAKPKGEKWPDANAGIKEIAGCATTADSSAPSTDSIIVAP